VVNGIDPLSPFDLTPRPLDQKPSVDAAAKVEEIQKQNELVKAGIEKTNASTSFRYTLGRNGFPPKADSLFEVLERINDNTYKVDLPSEHGVSATFIMDDSSAYQADDYLADLRIKAFQQGKDDGVALSQDNKEGPKSLTRSNATSKIQAMTQILEKSHGDALGLNN